MRSVHLSIIHRASDTRVFAKECRTLAQAGYEVHLVAAAPAAPEIDGVRLHSVSARPDRPRARNQITRHLRVIRYALALRPAVFHLHDPHLIPLGLLLKALGSRVVYDVHEHYPNHARTKLRARPWRRPFKIATWHAFELAARAAFDGFVCASPALGRRFPAGRTFVAANFPRHRDFAGGMWPPYRERPNTVIYTGNVNAARSYATMARAIELVPEELAARLLLVGEFRDRGLEPVARSQSSWERIDLEPWCAQPLLVPRLHSARIGLILLQPFPNHFDPRRSNKLFEYMAAGLPVIASDLPPWRELVAGHDCGLLVDPNDPAALADAIGYLLEHPEEAEAMGERGRAAVAARFNWDGESERLLALYRTLLGEPVADEPELVAAPEIVA